MTVKTINTELLSIPFIQDMVAVTPLQLGAMRKRVVDAIEKRREFETADGRALSKDFANLELWSDNEALHRMFVALKIDPVGYICQPMLTDAELVKRGFDPEARTRNLKAYKKVSEVASYVVTGSAKLESVFKTFVACALQASRFADAIPRDVCVRFLGSVDLSAVSPDLADAVREFQAKHMTGGADTQSSQMLLTLAQLRCGAYKREGRGKVFTLDATAPITQALAARFGMTDTLAKIAERQARVA